VGGHPVGRAEYQIDGRTMVFTHTEIDAAYGGQGLGTRLVETALDTARSRGMRVVPACAFMAWFMERHPAYADLTTG
jgi:predicted GNAT family acetyltransferase